MKKSLLYSFVLFAGLLHSQGPTGFRAEFDVLMSELDGLRAIQAPSAEISELSLRRDAGTFHFKKGTLYTLPPIGGSMHAMVFAGTGTFTFIPSTEHEKKQLYRFYETESFERNISSVFLLFTDTTFEELSRSVNFVNTNVPMPVRNAIKKSLRQLRNYDDTEYAPDIVLPFLYRDTKEMFYSDFTSFDGGSFFFHIDPYEIEEVSFGMIASVYLHRYRDVVCQFHRKSDYISHRSLERETKTNADIVHYTMDCSIDDDGELRSRCTTVFRVDASARRWVPMYLHRKAEVDSILWQNGTHAEWIRNEESNYLYLVVPDRQQHDTLHTVVIHYHGDLIRTEEGWHSLVSSTGWYPHSFLERDRATYDMTFRVPKRKAFASIGEKVAEEIAGDEKITRWVLNDEHRNASFVIGNYAEYTVAEDSIPPLTILISDAHNVSLRGYLASKGVLSGRDMDKQVAADIENSIRFFQHIYGPAVSKRFYTAEIPGSHGEAFPGLIHLSWSTFQNTSSYGDDEVFRAHEVAHQWWGIGVDFQSYHDQWISEGFATYSGLWYMQTVRRNNELFFDQLKKYKKAILANRKYLFSTGQEAGPIWLGRRTSTSVTAGDYGLIIYEKGAWVLHMLRNMSLELKTMEEKVFTGMMKDFYETYKGRYATTEDFRKIVEKHFGISMDWFFKQWLYNTDIPTYNITYYRQDLPDGKYKVRCVVKQSNVPDDFQMYVPFLIDFGDNRRARLRYLIKGPVTELEFPTLPLKPESITFNDLESVLCEIDDEDWD
ncbi:MAG: M1 family metallopeptidase [Bacteroidota bacterium]